MSAVNSLLNHLNVWRDIGANEQVLDWIEHGVKLSFLFTPNTYIFPNRIDSDKQCHFVDSEIESLLQSGAISTVDYQPHCVSALSCVPKKGNKLRLITDL